MITTSEIDKLTIQEKLILIEKIWSSLKQQDNELTTPSWHESVLNERRKKLKNGETNFITLDELRSRKS